MIVGAGACLGLFAFLTVRRHGESGDENFFVIEMLILSMAAALPAAMFFDSLFKIGTNDGFVLKGATFYGGLIGALALFSFLLALRKKRAVSVYDRLCDLAACIPLGHFFGRIGCFFGGCCYGTPTQSVFGIVFPPDSEAYISYGGVAVHPTQLYEADCLLVIFALLMTCGKKSAFPFYCMFYGTARFCIEFFRGDSRGSLPFISLSPAQFVSLFLIVLGGTVYAVHTIRETGKEFDRIKRT